MTATLPASAGLRESEDEVGAAMIPEGPRYGRVEPKRRDTRGLAASEPRASDHLAPGRSDPKGGLPSSRRSGDARARRIAARSANALVFLEFEDVWAFEAAGRLAFVHSRAGRFDLDVTLSRLEAMLDDRFVRVHRSWVVNLPLVGAIERQDARMQLLVGAKLGRDGIRVPVSRSLAKATRARLLRGAVGIRLAR